MSPDKTKKHNLLSSIINNYGVRRILRMIFVMWLVTTMIFVLIRYMPGSPIDAMVQELVSQRGLSIEEARDMASQMVGLNLEEPIISQYINYLNNLLHGDLGKSYRSPGKDVSELIMARLPWTLFSVGIALTISFILGITLGAIMAYRRGGFTDNLLSNIAAVLDAIPGYLTAIIVFLLLGVVWKIYPLKYMRGAISPGVEIEFSAEFLLDAFRHLLIPALVYLLATFGAWMLTMKSSTISVLGEDYVTAARARGLSESRILSAYVARNASLPLVTRLAVTIGFVVGGSVIIEQIFTYQGIGMLLLQAISSRDYPVMQGVFLVTTITVILANFFADILYGLLDPRVRTGTQE
jgi:peptide/nickel transport system permease protein